MESLTMCCKLVLKQMQNKSKAEQPVSRAPVGKAAEQPPAGELPQLTLSEGNAVSADAMGDQSRGTTEAQRPAAEQSSDGSDASTLAPTSHEHGPSNGDGAAAAAVGLGLHFKNEWRGEEDTIRLLPGADTHAVPSDANNQNGKKICPRCSLKFKPNVKQCPICRISLVPEDAEAATVTHDSAVELLPPPLIDLKAMDNEPEPAGKSPEAEPDGDQVEIVSCDQALRASPTAITIPLRMRIKKTNAEVMVELTVSITNSQLHSC
jgi:hypothetical protein